MSKRMKIPAGWCRLKRSDGVLKGDRFWSPYAQKWAKSANWSMGTGRQSSKFVYIREQKKKK